MKATLLVSALLCAPLFGQDCQLEAPVIANPTLHAMAGSSVASYDGWMAVGVPADEAGENGRVLMYEFVDGEWQFDVELTSPAQGPVADRFGAHVAMSGTVMAVSAPGSYITPFASGRVFLYYLEQDGPEPEWTYWHTFSNPSVQAVPSEYGAAVDLHSTHVAVGAPMDDEAGFYGGAVYSYRIDVDPPELDYVFAGQNDGDRFGASVSQFGKRTLVGIPGNDDQGIDAGQAQMWDAVGFHFITYIRAPEGADGLEFGTSVDIDLGTPYFPGRLNYAVGGSGGLVQAKRREVGGGIASTTLYGEYTSDRKQDDGFGSTVVLDNGRLWIGAPFEDSNGVDSGAVYVYDTDPEFSVEDGDSYPVGRIEGASAGANFGATLSIDTLHQTIVVGAPRDIVPAVGGVAGSVYCFPMPLEDCRSLADAPLLAAASTVTPTGEMLGASVAGYNQRVLLSRPSSNDYGLGSGAVSSLFLTSDGYAVGPDLVAPTTSAGDEFGASLEVFEDVALVGAPGDEILGTSTGAVHLFERGHMGWKPNGYLAPWGLGPDARFGEAVELEYKWAFGSFEQSGTYGGVRAFEEITPGSWVQRGDLFSSALIEGDEFGAAIDADLYGSVSQFPASGTLRLVIGAPGVENSKGRAHVYEPQPGGWYEREFVMPGGLQPGDRFGAVVAVSSQAPVRVAVGAPGTDNGTGRVYVFEEEATKFGPRLVLKWTLASPISLPGQRFGATLDISAHRVHVGAPAESGAGNGHVHEFLMSTETNDFELKESVTLPIHHDGDRFGESFAWMDGGLMVGAPGAYTTGTAHLSNSFLYNNFLQGDRHFVSLAEGGQQQLHLRSSFGNGTGDIYWILGSLSGVGPTPFFGVDLPLSVDFYFNLLLNTPAGAPIDASIGVLQGQYGEADVTLTVPAGLPPSFANLTLQHSWIQLNENGIEFVSNAEHLHLLP